MRTSLIAAAIAGMCTGVARGAYIMTPLSGDAGALTVAPGGEFDLQLVLSRELVETHNSSIVRVVFSAPGLQYRSLTWALPYSAQYDDSTPDLALLPVMLLDTTLAGSAYPAGVVDVELSNVVPSGVFDEGLLATLRVYVPPEYAGPEVLTIGVEPDTFANGFDEVQVVAGPSFVLTIPGPGAATVVLFAAWHQSRRRRVRT